MSTFILPPSGFFALVLQRLSANFFRPVKAWVTRKKNTVFAKMCVRFFVNLCVFANFCGSHGQNYGNSYDFAQEFFRKDAKKPFFAIEF